MMSDIRQREFLRSLFDAAVAAVDPAHCVPPHLPDANALPKGQGRTAGRTVVIGAGKAAAAMARAVETHWPGEPARLSGLVVTRYGHGMAVDKVAPASGRIEVIEAAHPVPDAAGALAAQRMVALVSGLTADDLVLVLLSGGGSALLTAPLPCISLDEKRAVNRALLACGASIGEINCVRKHLSAIKGGRLALAAAPARVLTLAISDVPGDDLSTVASGPTVPDPTTCDEALEIIDRYGVSLPPAARCALQDGRAESPKAVDPRFSRCEGRIIATARDALSAAAEAARAQGVTPLVLGDAIEGEAREVARVLGGIALSCAAAGLPLAAPCVLLSGGETTVTVKGKGRGGRNAEFLLGLALALGAHPRIAALACDTDGIDGSEDNAGALILPDTLARAAAVGIAQSAMRERLADNDAYGIFAALGDLVVTGPTRTNVNDFRAILIDRHD
jgi:hydroxypyruvate reductase